MCGKNQLRSPIKNNQRAKKAIFTITIIILKEKIIKSKPRIIELIKKKILIINIVK